MSGRDSSPRWVRTDAGVQYEDTLGAIADVNFAGEYSRALLDVWPEDGRPEGGPVPQALWVAALIAYARVWGGGTRQPPPLSLLDGLHEGAREAHELFLTLRDKHFAHSVNGLEQVRAIVNLGPPPAYAVAGSGYLVMRVETAATRRHVVALWALCRELLRELDKRREALEAEIRADVEAMSPAARAALPLPRIVMPGRREYSRPRKHRQVTRRHTRYSMASRYNVVRASFNGVPAAGLSGLLRAFRDQAGRTDWMMDVGAAGALVSIPEEGTIQAELDDGRTFESEYLRESMRISNASNVAATSARLLGNGAIRGLAEWE